MQNSNICRRYFTFLVLLAVASGLVWMYAHKNHPDEFQQGIETIVRCAEEKDAIICAREPVQQLLLAHKASDIIAALSKTSVRTNQCHYLSHVVGQETYHKYRDVEVALGECDRACGSACIHGAIGAAFTEEIGLDESKVDPEHLSPDEILSAGEKLCLTVNTCHGVGHALFMSYQKFGPALSACRSLSTGARLTGCYGGVFMEYFGELSSQSMWGEDSSPAFPNIEDLPTFCQFPSLEERRACYWHFTAIAIVAYESAGISEPKENSIARVQKICESLPRLDREACIFGIGTNSYSAVFTDRELALRTCDRFTTALDKASCVLGVVAIVSTHKRADKLLSYCDGMAEQDIRAHCFRSAFIYLYKVNEPIEDTKKLCPQMDDVCVSSSAYYRDDPWDLLNKMF